MLIFKIISLEQLKKKKEWWNLYYQSFPRLQREPRIMILAAIRNNNAIAIQALLNRKIVGISLIYIASDPPHVFLDYIAVKNKVRGNRIGAKLFNYSCAVGIERVKSKKLNPLGIFWEVQNEKHCLTKNNQNKFSNNLIFFKKQGGKVIPIYYLQPPISPKSKPVELVLMYKDLRNKKINKLLLFRILHSIYFEGCEPIKGIKNSFVVRTFMQMIKKNKLLSTNA